MGKYVQLFLYCDKSRPPQVIRAPAKRNRKVSLSLYSLPMPCKLCSAFRISLSITTKASPAAVKSDCKNVNYIWRYLRFELRERNIELRAIPRLQRFCHSRFHLHAMHIPGTIVYDENIVAHIYFGNGRVPFL